MGLPLPQKNFKIFLHLKNGYKLIYNKFLGQVPKVESPPPPRMDKG